MLTLLPISVLLMGLLGMTIVLVSVARVVVAEMHARHVAVIDPEAFDRAPVRL